MNDQKQCRECKTVKPVTDFGSAKKNRDGLNLDCRPCAQKKRREYKRERLEGMTDEQLEAEEAKRREYKRRWRQQNPEQAREQKARTRLRQNIPKWEREVAELKELLRDFEAVAERGPNGRWPYSPTAARYDLEMRWADTIRRLSWYSQRRANEGRSTEPHGVICAYIEELQGKLEATSPEDHRAAHENASADHNWHGNLPLSARRMVDELLAEFEEQRREARARMTAEERAAERADFDAWYWATTRDLDEFEMSDQARLYGLRKRAQDKMASYRAGAVRYHEVRRAEDEAAIAEATYLTEHEAETAFKYRELYPVYLKEEQARDRAAKRAATLLADL